MQSPAREVVRSTVMGLLATAAFAGLIVLGSRNLRHFDAALVAYTFATLFATFAIVYRYSMWLHRPPTALYWKRGWQVFFQRGYIVRHAGQLVRRTLAVFALNNFIWRRGRAR